MEAGGALFKANNCGMAFFLFVFFFTKQFTLCVYLYDVNTQI